MRPSTSSHFLIWTRTIRAWHLVTTSWSFGASCEERAKPNGSAFPQAGGSFAVPFANIVPFKDGLMAGEAVYFDLATLCEQAGLNTDEVRAAAKARA
jgi:hypothetical protein